ncbi:hypothetical protein DL96DRAFT_1606495 [Flagelloscypha sp. PMI_526]|nr:hypothetical protein DL96DRAFT_1606495 [Flagelloscypha sp. PMI_526]
MSLSELPADILPFIFEELTDLELLRCASVSQMWRTLAFPILLQTFSHVTLTSYHRKQTDPKRLLKLFSEIWPDHVQRIQHVSIFLYCTSRLFERQAAEFLQHLPNLRNFGIQGSQRYSWTEELHRLGPILKTHVLPRLTSLEISCMVTIPLLPVLATCPALEELTLVDSTITLPESIDITILKSRPLRHLTLWKVFTAREWYTVTRFFEQFIEISSATITSFHMGCLGSGPSPVPFTKTIPWLRCLSENLQTLNVWETLFHSLVRRYVERTLNQWMLEEDELNAFQLKNFPQLQSFRSAVSLPKQKSGIEIATFFMDWLSDQVSSLSPSHSLRVVSMDVIFNRGCSWGPLQYWDGTNPVVPTAWRGMDAAFSKRAQPIRAEFSIHYLMARRDEMEEFIRGALPCLHERRLLHLGIGYKQ